MPSFDSRARRRQGVLKAVLLLFEFGFGRRANAQFGDAASQFGQALFQFLTVVIGIGVLDLTANLLHATGDRFARAAALDEWWVSSLVMMIFSAVPNWSTSMFSSLMPKSSLKNWPPVSVAMSSNIAFATVAKAGRLDSSHVEDAPDAVDNQSRQSLALDVLGDDDQRLASARDFLQNRHQILHVADFLLVDQNQRVVEARFHALGVGYEVGR